MLAGIPLDSGTRHVSDNYKVEKYIKISMLYLQDDESVSAETFINRASLLITEETSEALKLQHKVCYARILDAKRKFLEAAGRYYHLSQLTTRTFGELSVSEEDMITSLRMAVTCALLAPAGPQRSRMLGTLYKDERSHALPNFPMLEKMFMERLLRSEEVSAFASGLAPHQKATLEDGVETVLDRAVVEHNMLATSKLYANITFDRASAGLDPPTSRPSHPCCPPCLLTQSVSLCRDRAPQSWGCSWGLTPPRLSAWRRRCLPRSALRALSTSLRAASSLNTGRATRAAPTLQRASARLMRRLSTSAALSSAPHTLHAHTPTRHTLHATRHTPARAPHRTVPGATTSQAPLHPSSCARAGTCRTRSRRSIRSFRPRRSREHDRQPDAAGDRRGAATVHKS